MSLLPYLLTEMGGHLYHPAYNRYNNYGRGFNPYDSGRIPKSSIKNDGFHVCLDVQEFTPNELSVKAVDNTLVVEGKHEERQDEHGYITRQFKRRYDLPQDFDINDVITELSSDGVLTIKAPTEPKALDQGKVRVLQIQQTGPARLKGDDTEITKPNMDDNKQEIGNKENVNSKEGDQGNIQEIGFKESVKSKDEVDDQAKKNE